MEYLRDVENNLTDMVRQCKYYKMRNKRLQCDIDIELNKMMFHLTSDGSSVIITFKKIADAFALFKVLVGLTTSIDVKRNELEEFLRNNGLTIYIQNRHFGILGQHANKILAWTVAAGGRFFLPENGI